MSTRFPIPDAALSQHILLLGKTRSGKSSKMRVIVERFLDKKKPVCIVDPKGDWWGLKSSADSKQAGYNIIIFGSEFARYADVRINKHHGAAIAQLVATGNRSCVIDLKGMRVSERAQFFIEFASTYFKLASGERVLALDEVHNFAPQGKVLDPQSGEMLHWANRLVNEGGGLGITVLSASQRPQKVHKDYTSAHETLIANRVIQKHDRDAIRDWIDACGDLTIAKDVLGSLAGMQRPEAWVYSPEAGFGPERITFPMFKTYDSFKPQSDTRKGKLKGWAEIDLADVESNLAKVFEEAKANDPKELRAEITKLKAELAKKPKVETVSTADTKAVTAAEARGRAIGKIEGYAEGVNEITAIWREMAGNVLSSIKFTTTTLETSDKKMQAVLERASKKHVKAASKIAAKQPGPPTGSIFPAPAPPRAPLATPARAPSPAPAGGDGSSGDGTITGPMKAILNSLATWAQLGQGDPSNAQVAWLAGYSPKSSSSKNPRSSLKTAGLIVYPANDHVRITAEGFLVSQPIMLPGSLLDFVLSNLPGPEGVILKSIAAHHPNAIDNETAATGANYSASSSSYKNPRSALRTKDLISYPDNGKVRASDWLFAA